MNNLNKLSDKDLILKAVASGNYTKIRFSGSNANDPNTPSFKKKLGNRKQLIEALLDATWEVNSTDSDLVDRLSIYLHISQDIQKDPNKKSFFYQIVDKKGINQREFTIDGIETIEIGKNAIETIRIVCPELKLVFNVSEDYNFMPVYISKTNGKTNFQLTLTDYNQ